MKILSFLCFYKYKCFPKFTIVPGRNRGDNDFLGYNDDSGDGVVEHLPNGQVAQIGIASHLRQRSALR